MSQLSETCLLYDSCPTFDDDCFDCVSGARGCSCFQVGKCDGTTVRNCPWPFLLHFYLVTLTGHCSHFRRTYTGRGTKFLLSAGPHRLRQRRVRLPRRLQGRPRLPVDDLHEDGEAMVRNRHQLSYALAVNIPSSPSTLFSPSSSFSFLFPCLYLLSAFCWRLVPALMAPTKTTYQHQRPALELPI